MSKKNLLLEAKKFAVFIFGGSLGAMINLSITYLLTEFLEINYLLSYSFGIAGNIIFNFFYHRSVTFKIKDEQKKRFAKFIATSLAVSACLVGSIYFLTEFLKFWYIFSGVFSIGIFSILNYLANKYWVFSLHEKKKIEDKNSAIDKLIYLLIGIYIAIFSLLSVSRHLSLKSYLNDLGTYDQLLWNTLHGNFFGLTCGMLDIPNYLNAHFSPILLFFVPFYLFKSSPIWLLLFQSISVGLSALPIYWLAKEKFSKNRWLPLIFLLCFLLYPILHNGLLYDFHEVTFATSFASFAFYFLLKRKDGLFVVFATLLALSQEHLSLLVFMMGVYLIFIKKRKKFGFWVSICSIAYFILTIFFLMPYFSKSGGLALMEDANQYGSRYSWLGDSFGSIISNIYNHPVEILKVIFSFDRIKYIFLLVAPLFSLPLYSWPIIIIVPIVALNLLSINSMTFNIFFYHSTIMSPFLFFSAIFCFKKWFYPDPLLRLVFAGLIIFSSTVFSIYLSVSPISPYYKLDDYIPDHHAKQIKKIKKMIPSDAVLSVQHNLGPHFSTRREIYRFPLKKSDADYILIDQKNPYEKNPNQVFNFEYALQLKREELIAYLKEISLNQDYKKILDDDGYILFKKK